jgi:hypothetical protein
MNPIQIFSAAAVIIIGAFLFLDGLFIHAVGYNYAALGLQVLDPFVNHWWIGLALLVFGLVDLHYTMDE